MKRFFLFALVAVASGAPAKSQTAQSSRYEFVVSDKSDPNLVAIVFDRSSGCLARVSRTQRIDREGFILDGKKVGQGDTVLELSFEPWTCPRPLPSALRNDR
jgi:hypothetical protein